MTFDPAAYLASLAKAIDVQELVRRGDLVDCSKPARWVGFEVPAYMSAACWEAIIGPRTSRIRSPNEHHVQGGRLHNLWSLVGRQMNVVHKAGKGFPDHVPVHAPLATGGALQRLEVRVVTHNRETYVVVKLTGE